MGEGKMEGVVEREIEGGGKEMDGGAGGGGGGGWETWSGKVEG